jgi:hypothetical protein
MVSFCFLVAAAAGLFSAGKFPGQNMASATTRVSPASDSVPVISDHNVIKDVVKVRTQLGERGQTTLQIFAKKSDGNVNITDWIINSDNGRVIHFLCDVPPGQDMWVEAWGNVYDLSFVKIHVHDVGDIN